MMHILYWALKDFHEVNLNESPHEHFMGLFYFTSLNVLFYYQAPLKFQATLLSTRCEEEAIGSIQMHLTSLSRSLKQ